MKKRFGISINEEIFYLIDHMAQRLNLDRSRLIEEAIKFYLDKSFHEDLRHTCTSIFIVACEDDSNLKHLIDDYQDITLSTMHTHSGDRCIDVIVVSGDSERVDLLHKDILRNSKNCKTLHLPLD